MLLLELLSLEGVIVSGIRLHKIENLCATPDLVYLDTSQHASFLLYGPCLRIFLS